MPRSRIGVRLPRSGKAWLAVLAVVAARALAADPAVPLDTVVVAPGVHVHQGALDVWSARNDGRVANVGFVVGERCVAVVDTGGSVAEGRALRARIAAATPLPVCWVINTHAHPDHVLGNVAFTDAPQPPVFVAAARYAASLRARERHIAAAVEREFGQPLDRNAFVYPGVEVTPERPLELDLGGRSLVLHAWPTSHTDHDLTVLDTKTGTLFAGDLLFARHIPVLDGSLRGWVATLQSLQRRTDVTIVVPGHGPPSRAWPGALDAEQRYLGTVLRETRAAIKAHVPIQRAVDTVGRAAAQSWQLADEFHRRNVTAAYAELEWEE